MPGTEIDSRLPSFAKMTEPDKWSGYPALLAVSAVGTVATVGVSIRLWGDYQDRLGDASDQLDQTMDYATFLRMLYDSNSNPATEFHLYPTFDSPEVLDSPANHFFNEKYQYYKNRPEIIRIMRDKEMGATKVDTTALIQGLQYSAESAVVSAESRYENLNGNGATPIILEQVGLVGLTGILACLAFRLSRRFSRSTRWLEKQIVFDVENVLRREAKKKPD